MNQITLSGALALSISVWATASLAQGDAFIRDTSTDTGVEPYEGPGPVYQSPDIWVRREPDPNFSPYPFPTASPGWTPQPHQNPEYRDSKTGRPNYVYVRIHNRGRTATTGTERLRLYQAKAGTGLSWPGAWVNNMAMACGENLLHGIEVTKPRRNALDVTLGEFNRYVNAVTAISTNNAYQYSDGVQYWQKQQSVHADAGNPEHGNPAFLPWHREMTNRYEERLKEHDPLVTLLYWDWTESVADFINRGFVGTTDGTFPFGGVTLRRRVGEQSCVFDSDATLLSATYDDYANFANRVEDWPRNHDCGHVHIGGTSTPEGNMSEPAISAQDPIFFVHHANVDRIWSTWQRDGADPTRLDPAVVYGANSSNPRINATMSPWDGDTVTLPWQGASAISKTSKNRSVVYPPIYDTAPLNIPALQPGESVIVEIPWYPPNVNSFNCVGDAGHFCLLARIETATGAPYGMTFPEGTNVSTNTRENNNIAWKNLTIVDDEVEAFFFMAGTSVHNFFDRELFFDIRLFDRTNKRRFILQEFADLALILPEAILERLKPGKDTLRDLELTEMKWVDQPVLKVVGNNPTLTLVLKPDERFAVQFAARLHNEKVIDALLEEPFHFDLEQHLAVPGRFLGLKAPHDAEVGGVRFTLDFAEFLKKKEQAKGGAVRVADLTLSLRNDLISKRAELAQIEDGSAHVSPGEPAYLSVEPSGVDKTLRRLSVTVDGKEIGLSGQNAVTREAISFDAPGVHRIVAESLDEEGTIIRRELRVLVSENIPPAVVIAQKENMLSAKLGEPIKLTAITVPAYQRSIEEVTLHVKDDRSLRGGLNLVKSDFYPPVDRLEGEGPHEFSYTPKKPGMYMLQVGARDDNGIVGVSGHLMVMVKE